MNRIEEAKELDQFYTNPIIAERFVKKVDEIYGFSNYQHIIEPSMGEGFIYKYLPEDKRIGLDLQKNHPDCLEGDFLKWNPEKSGIDYNPLLGRRPEIMFVGNPPFGRSSALALEFFHHCSNFSDVICFIIPVVWSSISIQDRIPRDFGLYWQATLPEFAFLLDNKPYPVKCVAQCWSRYDPQPDLDIDNSEDWTKMKVR